MVTIKPIRSKSILSPASGYIGAYDYTMSPYAGCSFGCSYCYVPTLVHHRKLADSWGYSLFYKENAPELLLRDAKGGKLAGKSIFLSPNTDPYLPQERRTNLTRRLLEVMSKYPPRLLVVQTRSPLLLRDLDLLRELQGTVVVAMSITTDDEQVRRLFEPRCAPVSARADALASLHEAGVRTQASLAPLLPCNPDRLAEMVGPHSDWVVVQALKMVGPGARTWAPALRIVESHDLRGWLQGGDQVRVAMTRLKTLLGPKYHEGRAGFSLGWLG